MCFSDRAVCPSTAHPRPSLTLRLLKTTLSRTSTAFLSLIERVDGILTLASHYAIPQPPRAHTCAYLALIACPPYPSTPLHPSAPRPTLYIPVQPARALPSIDSAVVRRLVDKQARPSPLCRPSRSRCTTANFGAPSRSTTVVLAASVSSPIGHWVRLCDIPRCCRHRNDNTIHVVLQPLGSPRTLCHLLSSWRNHCGRSFVPVRASTSRAERPPAASTSSSGGAL